MFTPVLVMLGVFVFLSVNFHPKTVEMWHIPSSRSVLHLICFISLSSFIKSNQWINNSSFCCCCCTGWTLARKKQISLYSQNSELLFFFCVQMRHTRGSSFFCQQLQHIFPFSSPPWCTHENFEVSPPRWKQHFTHAPQSCLFIPALSCMLLCLAATILVLV